MNVSKWHLECEHKSVAPDLFNKKEFKKIVFICLLWTHMSEFFVF